MYLRQQWCLQRLRIRLVSSWQQSLEIGTHALAHHRDTCACRVSGLHAMPGDCCALAADFYAGTTCTTVWLYVTAAATAVAPSSRVSELGRCQPILCSATMHNLDRAPDQVLCCTTAYLHDKLLLTGLHVNIHPSNAGFEAPES